jgi:hypothetical protein
MCISSVSFVMSSWRVTHVWMWESNAEQNLSSVSSFFRCLPLKLNSIPPELRCRLINMTVHELCWWGTCCVSRALLMWAFICTGEDLRCESTGALMNYVMCIKRRQTNDDFRTFSCTWKLFRPAFVLNGIKTLADGKLRCISASFSWVHYINKLVCLSWRFWLDEWM